MPLFLKKRNEQLTEQMDQPDCDNELLLNTYRQFSTINRLISGWPQIYRKLIRPILAKNPSHSFSFLDIGCGGGDIIRLLDNLTKKDGYDVVFTGIDPDARAIQFLSEQQWPENISFSQATSSELAETHSFDIVISNHLVHHLTKNQLVEICHDAEQLAANKIIFNDIERSDIGYASFKVSASLIFRNSFIVSDGLTSIKRSFRKQELQKALPQDWKVYRQFPFRLLASYDVAANE